MKKRFDLLIIVSVFCILMQSGCVTYTEDDPYGYNYRVNENNDKNTTDAEDDNKPPNTYVQIQHYQSGDTFVMTNNKILKLAGISTPRPGEAYYKKARDYAKYLVGLNFLRLVWVKGTKRGDNVWRANIIIKHNDMIVSLNEQLVKIGLAKVTASEPITFQTLNLEKEGKVITLSDVDNKSIYEKFKRLEKEAQEKKLNLWSGKYEE